MQQLSTSFAKLSNYSETNKKKTKKIPPSAAPTAGTTLRLRQRGGRLTVVITIRKEMPQAIST